LIRHARNIHPKGNIMAADIKPQESTDSNQPTHARDYAGFITLLKWTMLIVAIIAAAVIYIISN
jgi:hypothetical protein